MGQWGQWGKGCIGEVAGSQRGKFNIEKGVWDALDVCLRKHQYRTN